MCVSGRLCFGARKNPNKFNMRLKERKQKERDHWRSGYEPIAHVEQTTVPPAYMVRETRDGRLVNDSYGVEWPERPRFGRYAQSSREISKYSVSSLPKHSQKHHCEYRKGGKSYEDEDFVDERQTKPKSQRRSVIHNSSSEECSRNETKERNGSDDDFLFVGAQTTTTVSNLLRPNEFRLYYQIPSSNEITVPIRIPLCLAYMSVAEKVYHFPVVCTKNQETGTEAWQVQYGDPRPTSFASLAALVKYHKLYSYMDPKTGAIDTFPVWKGTIIDVDDFD